VRAFAETSYRADVAFCLMTLLAAVMVACDTGGVASSNSAEGRADSLAASPTAQVQVIDPHARADARTHAQSETPTVAVHPDDAVTRR
jgi:hypothetical protein